MRFTVAVAVTPKLPSFVDIIRGVKIDAEIHPAVVFFLVVIFHHSA